MTVILPSGQGAQSNYNPFPDALPTFAGIDETVTGEFFMLHLKYYASHLPEHCIQLKGFQRRGTFYHKIYYQYLKLFSVISFKIYIVTKNKGVS